MANKQYSYFGLVTLVHMAVRLAAAIRKARLNGLVRLPSKDDYTVKCFEFRGARYTNVMCAYVLSLKKFP